MGQFIEQTKMLCNELLVAAISDSARLMNCDAKVPAVMRWERGIKSKYVTATDHDSEAPMTGRMVAIFSSLRILEMKS